MDQVQPDQKRNREGDQYEARSSQDERRQKVEAELQAERPGLRHDESRPHDHVGIVKIRDEPEHPVLRAGEHKPVLAEEDDAGDRKGQLSDPIHGIEGADRFMRDPECRVLNENHDDRRQRDGPVHGEKAKNAVCVERGRGPVGLRLRQDEGNQKPRNDVEQLDRQPSADEHEPVAVGEHHGQCQSPHYGVFDLYNALCPVTSPGCKISEYLPLMGRALARPQLRPAPDNPAGPVLTGENRHQHPPEACSRSIIRGGFPNISSGCRLRFNIRNQYMTRISKYCGCTSDIFSDYI